MRSGMLCCEERGVQWAAMPCERESPLELAADVDELVADISQKLRLKRDHRPRRARPCPYDKYDKGSRRVEDPHELLQRLIEARSLVAEAVRRLRRTSR